MSQLLQEVAIVSKNREILQWRSNKSLALALICWTVGLGNCWRFPVAASLDGAGAFLLPYLLETFFIAIPFSYMEIGLGQFSSKGPVAIWALSPIMKGIGYGSTFLIISLMVYYNIICSYLLFFFFASLSSVLPWSICDPKWAKRNCFTFKDNSSIRLSCIRKYGEEECNSMKWENSASQYWKVRVLDRSLTGYFGTVRWDIVICSTVTAFLLFLINCRGTKSIEKVVVFLSIFPYLELVVLLFVSLINPGSSRGMKIFMTPDFNKLLTFSPWRVAFEQILFSTGLGLGGLITLGSQCHIRSSVHLEAIALNLIDIASSMCYGIMIFNCLGAVSYDLNIPIEEIIGWNDALLFAKIPLSLMHLPGVPQIWSGMFYSSIYIIGLRSQALMMATVLNTIYDSYEKMLEYTVMCSAACAIFILILGYPFMTQIGSILLNYVDNIVAGPTITMVCFLETIGVVCVYGITRFVDDMHFMLGFRASAYWQIFWTASPLLFCLMILNCTYHLVREVEDTPPWTWMLVLQWIIFSIPVMLLIVGMVSTYAEKKKTTKFVKMFKPSITWGPTDPILKKSREMFTAHSMTKEYMYRQNRLVAKINYQNAEGQE